MTSTKGEVRSGVYFDSIVLMQLQRSLAGLQGVLDAGVVMGTEANKNLLAQGDLLAPEVQSAGMDDLVIVIKAEDELKAQAGLAKVDELLASRRKGEVGGDYHPKSLESAVQMNPAAQWVFVSVPGRFAAGVAREALRLNKHVFLYSDNVALDDEIELKQTAREKGLLVMGPDCGTAIVNGVGLGFANRIRRGPIGVVAASGTGLQQVTSRIHQFGGGITHALGTGGRDLSEQVGAMTARQGLDLLDRDPDTKVIVLISKPPSSRMAGDLIDAARLSQKPVVVDFIGYSTATRRIDNVYFAPSFDETAEMAVQFAATPPEAHPPIGIDLGSFAPGQRYLRGLFSGGTLAYETLLVLRDYLPRVYSNAPLDKQYRLADSLTSQEHTILDLGEDEFTVGRLHPMMDNDLRNRRLEIEAHDPTVAVILIDVVLGFGAHPDPASELAPTITRARAHARQEGRHLEVAAVVSGTDEDPQDIEKQVGQLMAAGVKIFYSNDQAARNVGRIVQKLDPNAAKTRRSEFPEVNLSTIKQPMAAINVGLETFTESLTAQNAACIQVDWRPPASGNEKLMAILERMKSK